MAEIDQMLIQRLDIAIKTSNSPAMSQLLSEARDEIVELRKLRSAFHRDAERRMLDSWERNPEGMGK
jgi:hypothetical protein